MQRVRAYSIILLGLCFTAMFIGIYGNVNGGGCCKPGTCDENAQAHILPVSSVVSPELCKDTCCNTSLCQMSIVSTLNTCQFFNSHGCRAIPYVKEVHFCDKDCYDPPAPSNGTVNLTVTGVTTYKATAKLYCNTGYFLNGSDIMMCNADEMWSQNAECIINDCKYPAQPANGVVKLTVDLLTTYGASALVTCNTGYKIRGDGLLLCKADGLWSTLPSCIIKDCKYPEQPANGVVELTVDLLTTYGASAHVTCNTGYELRGDGLLLCKADGLWSTLPSCNIKAYIPAVAASCGAVGLGIAFVAVYWFGCRRWMKPFSSVCASNSSDSNKENTPDHEQSTDGVTPDVK